MRITPSRDEIKQLFANVMCSSVPGLQPVKINDLVYRILPVSAKINDQRLRGINTYLCHAIGPLLCLLDNLISVEQYITSDDATSAKVEGEKVYVNQVCLDVKTLRSWVHHSVRLLSCANSVVLMKRKSQIRGFLEPQYQHLTKASNLVTDELLGTDL